MKCPYCRKNTTDIFNTRPTRFGTQVWRRRKCLSCHESFTTYEAPDLGFLKVIKKNGRKQRYSRAKLFSGVYGAFLSIPAKETTVDGVTDTIEAKILDTKKRELKSVEIAGIVLATLKHFNTAAFVRYLAYQTDLASDAQLKRELKKY
ncbi:MAG TPA: ATP cone domain-containing protein [Candidatus Saccharimonadales bacterium]|nr:ATP cone domain-containing protein [Candidatus Saccharimonadales bacterium]